MNNGFEKARVGEAAVERKEERDMQEIEKHECPDEEHMAEAESQLEDSSNGLERARVGKASFKRAGEREINVMSERHKGGRIIRWNEDLPAERFGDRLRRALAGLLSSDAHIDNACLRHSNGDAVNMGDLHQGRITGNVFLDEGTDITEVD